MKPREDLAVRNPAVPAGFVPNTETSLEKQICEIRGCLKTRAKGLSFGKRGV